MKQKPNYLILYCGDWNGIGYLYQVYSEKNDNGRRKIIGAFLDTPTGWVYKEAYK